MMWTTTGNLTNVRNNAKFPFGVAMLPAGKRRGSPTGGGNFYISKKAPRAQQEAAFKFIRWITTPERAAQWCVDTGYVAVRPDAFETPALKKYVADFPPAAVARDQLQFAVAELSTHENQRVTKALNDGLQAALTGTKSPEQAMKDSQARSRAHPSRAIADESRPSPSCNERAAEKFAMGRPTATIHGWLLLLPAMALLALFTHWPALATFIDSFYSTPRPRRAAVFVGLENYRQIIDDPMFWQALTNNMWFAVGTIPVSIGLAMLMALWVNDRIAGRTLVRMAYFTPTVLPMIAVANIWLFFYTPQYGLLAQVLARVRRRLRTTGSAPRTPRSPA